MLNTKYSSKSKLVGMIFGKFYPLHIGHIYIIQRACGQVDELNVILCHNKERDGLFFINSSISQQPTIGDRLRWLLQTFKYQKNIFIYPFDEKGIDLYQNGWQVWSDNVKKFLISQNIQPQVIFSGKPSDIVYYKKYFGTEVVIIDPERTFVDISSSKIRKTPFRYWEYMPTEVRSFFVRKVVILGGESSGKSTLVNKLANAFNTTCAWEYGRDYIFSHLGGNEIALQYSDYDKIALGHVGYINFAVKYANKVVFIDTDFITTQAFCEHYEGRSHAFVQALIDEYRFDLVILLENNTPWIADGLRCLGSNEERLSFQNLLIKLLIKNKVEFVVIDTPNYDERFLKSIELVQQILIR